MSIDTSSEELIALKDAAKYFPGRRPADQTVFRWANKGLVAKNGERVFLEVCDIGVMRYTSELAIQRFVKAQNVRPETTGVTTGQRQREGRAAMAELEAAGV